MKTLQKGLARGAQALGWISPGLAALVSFALPPTCSLRGSSTSAGPAGSPPPSNYPRPGLRTLPQSVVGRGASSPAALGLCVYVGGVSKAPFPESQDLLVPLGHATGRPHTQRPAAFGDRIGGEQSQTARTKLELFGAQRCRWFSLVFLTQ